MTDLSHESLPDSIAIAFLDGKYVGVMKTGGKTEEIRGIRWGMLLALFSLISNTLILNMLLTNTNKLILN